MKKQIDEIVKIYREMRSGELSSDQVAKHQKRIQELSLGLTKAVCQTNNPLYSDVPPNLVADHALMNNLDMMCAKFNKINID